MIMIAGVAVAVFLISEFLVNYYLKRVSARLNRILDGMTQVMGGDLTVRLAAEKNGDELDVIACHFNEMCEKLDLHIQKSYLAEIDQKNAEMSALQSQINPHFLYNTLETIRMKARINKQYEIEELVKMLGKILRSSIQAGSKDMTIREEVELAEYYLKIQQYRFGERIQYQIYVEEGTERQKILPLLIQPLVENCIIHGLEGRADVGHIDVCVKRSGQNVVITVTDDGAGICGEKIAEIRRELAGNRTKGEHIGICNVNQRVRLRIYPGGDNASG